jgi:serine/threonine-protein kinase HipA
MLTLTPAYDICPQGRTGNEATQAMLIKGDNRASTLSTLLAAAPNHHLKETEAAALIERQITTIAEQWQEVCAQAELSPVDRKLLARRQFLNDYAIEGLETHQALREPFRAAQNALIASGAASRRLGPRSSKDAHGRRT